MGGEVEWLNRIGLTLQLVALFLVTPEIIGRERMTAALDKYSEKFATVARLIFGSLVVGFVAFDVWSRLVIPSHAVHGFQWRWIIINSAIWLGWAGLLVVIVISWNYVVKAARTFLPMGAVMFVLGFACLMWATFVHSGSD
jgi:hypothetical protein